MGRAQTSLPPEWESDSNEQQPSAQTGLEATSTAASLQFPTSRFQAEPDRLG
jgi:hypothetical protein